MGLFSFTQEIAMDLGTANTIIITNGKIVVDEPSVVALDRRTEKMGDIICVFSVTQIGQAPILRAGTSSTRIRRDRLWR